MVLTDKIITTHFFREDRETPAKCPVSIIDDYSGVIDMSKIPLEAHFVTFESFLPSYFNLMDSDSPIEEEETLNGPDLHSSLAWSEGSRSFFQVHVPKLMRSTLLSIKSAESPSQFDSLNFSIMCPTEKGCNSNKIPQEDIDHKEFSPVSTFSVHLFDKNFGQIATLMQADDFRKKKRDTCRFSVEIPPEHKDKATFITLCARKSPSAALKSPVTFWAEKNGKEGEKFPPGANWLDEDRVNGIFNLKNNFEEFFAKTTDKNGDTWLHSIVLKSDKERKHFENTPSPQKIQTVTNVLSKQTPETKLKPKHTSKTDPKTEVDAEKELDVKRVGLLNFLINCRNIDKFSFKFNPSLDYKIKKSTKDSKTHLLTVSDSKIAENSLVTLTVLKQNGEEVRQHVFRAPFAKKNNLEKTLKKYRESEKKILKGNKNGSEVFKNLKKNGGHSYNLPPPYQKSEPLKKQSTSRNNPIHYPFIEQPGVGYYTEAVSVVPNRGCPAVVSLTKSDSERNRYWGMFISLTICLICFYYNIPDIIST